MRIYPYTLRLVPILLFVVLCLSHSAAAQDCAQITRYGIFDIRRSANQADMVDDVIHWLTVNEYKTESEAKSAAASAGINIPVVDVQANTDATYGENHSSSWSKAVADYLSQHQESHTKASQEFITANPDIVSAWKACVEMYDLTGLHSQLVQIDACKSNFTVWFKPNSKESYPVIQTFDISGGTCSKPPTRKVPYAGFNVNCRKYGKSTLAVSLNTDKGNAQAHLEALPDDPEPPKQIMGTKTITSPQPAPACNVSRGVPGNSMSYSGTCVAPGPIVGARYDCTGPGCGWCYGFRNASREGDWDISGNTLTWYRRCEGWAAALMTYTLTYSVIVATPVDNPSYEEDHKRWEERQKALSCAGNSYKFQ